MNFEIILNEFLPDFKLVLYTILLKFLIAPHSLKAIVFFISKHQSVFFSFNHSFGSIAFPRQMKNVCLFLEQWQNLSKHLYGF